MSRRCADCKSFMYLGNCEYYCKYKDTSFVAPDDDACGGFDPVFGFEEKEKRRENQEDDYVLKHSD